MKVVPFNSGKNPEKDRNCEEKFHFDRFLFLKRVKNDQFQDLLNFGAKFSSPARLGPKKKCSRNSYTYIPMYTINDRVLKSENHHIFIFLFCFCPYYKIDKNEEKNTK